MSQLCTFEADGVLFGIAATEVQELARPQPITRVPLAHRAIAGLINLRGQIITAIDLRARLDMPRRAQGARAFHVVARAADGIVSLVVDAIGDVIEPPAELRDAVPATAPAALREVALAVYMLPDRLLFPLSLDRLVLLGDRS
ncbi:MAG TPA: chemotaxis protein CheW [Kofleriaceae bacterium]